MIRTIFFSLAFLTFPLTLFSCHSAKSAEKAASSTGSRVILGDEQFDFYTPLLEGKRAALFSNHSGIVGDKLTLSDGTVQYGGFASTGAGKKDASLIPFGFDADGKPVTYGEHILDALIAHGVNVTAIFSPEHGFRGNEDAGAHIKSGVDEKTGVPILSLYEDSNTHSPSVQSMATFDTLVVDMQDVGLRYYTYYIALYYLMDACAKNGKDVIILDRPNPNGFYVDGALLEDDYVSGVGRLPLPTVHGMTWGELARMINGEGYLTAGKDACALTVIPCRNYTHQTKYALIRAPSPNIKDMRAVYLYASTCFFENTIVSVARGTAFPFEAFGSPYFKNAHLARTRTASTQEFAAPQAAASGITAQTGAKQTGAQEPSALPEEPFSFVPQSIPGATNPPFLGEACYGKDLRSLPLNEIWSRGCDVSYLIDAYRAAAEAGKKSVFWGKPDARGRYWIDLLSGSAALRTQVSEGRTADEVKESWKDGIEQFKAQRKPYLLYAE